MANKDDIFATATLPRVLVVSRRSVRKNKFVDFVGEYHLDLLVTNGAVPVIVPRVAGIHNHLNSFDPFHGVLLCEGEDIEPSLHSTPTATSSHFSQSDIDEVRRLHRSDTNIDHNKDEIELALANLCFRRNIPILGICRGSQLLNVASGGTLFLDLQKQLPRGNGNDVVHIDYGNYDGHRHGVRLVEGTPLGSWFKESSVDGKIMVNSYHHQGVEKLAGRFVPMAFAMDGLVEGFYDPNCYVPEKGRFVVGLQFHPERMRMSPESEEFDYPGCKSVYQEFVKAVVSCQKMTRTTGSVPKSVMEVHQEVEKKAYIARVGAPTFEGLEIEAGDESNGWIKFGEEEETEAEGGCNCLMSEEKEMLARTMMGKVSMGQLSELLF